MGDLDEKPITIISGTPRVGKSRYIVGKLIKDNVESAVYISQKHEIVTHAASMFSSMSRKKMVKMEGKARLCINGNLDCKNCRLYPNVVDGEINDPNFTEKVTRQWDDSRSLSKKNIEGNDVCPYYALRYATDRSRFLFTVPQLVPEYKHYQFAIIDEDVTLSYYYPQSQLICRYNHFTNKHHSVKNEIPSVTTIKEGIEKKKDKSPEEIELLKCIEYIESLNSIFARFAENRITLETLRKRLQSVPRPEVSNPEAVLRYMDNKYPSDETRKIFEPILFPALKHIYIETGRFENKIYLVANEEQIIRNLPNADKIIIIGSKRAELFADAISPNECWVRPIENAPFLTNLLVIPIQGVKEVKLKGTKKYTRKSEDVTKKLGERLCKELYTADIPLIVVTGSSNAQDKLDEKLRKEGVSCQCSKQETRKEIMDTLLTGRPNIIYANSNISRGVDLDFYDVILLYQLDYSTPYWSAMISYWKELEQKYHKDGDVEKEKEATKNREYYEKIREQILIDETINLAFRIAPVKGQFEGYPKCIFVPAKYLPRLQKRMDELKLSTEFSECIYPEVLHSEEEIVNISKILQSNFRGVQKSRPNENPNTNNEAMGSQKKEILINANSYPNLPADAPILQAVADLRLRDFVTDHMEVVSETTEITPDKEETIRKSILAYIRDQIKDGSSKPITTESIIKHVQKQESVSSYCSPERTTGRPKKHLATRDQIRAILKRLKSEGILQREKQGMKNNWSLAPPQRQLTGTILPEE